MIASVTAHEHPDDCHCLAEAEVTYGRTHPKAVTLLVAFITPNSLLPQESGSRLEYAWYHLDRLLYSTLRVPHIVQYFGKQRHIFPRQQPISTMPPGNESPTSVGRFPTLQKLFTRSRARPSLPIQHLRRKSEHSVIGNSSSTRVSPH